jgi:hypothetical protein
VDEVYPQLVTCVYSGIAMLNRVVQRKGLDVGLCYDGNTIPGRRNHAVTRAPIHSFRVAGLLQYHLAVRAALAPAQLLTSCLIQRQRSQEGAYEA